MPAHGLRPQAEGAARFAAAAGVQRHVRVQQIADEIVLDPQVALVDLGDERKLVHVLKDGAVLVVDDRARAVAEGNAVHRAPVRPSAISLMVKSNSLRATKSIGAPWARLSAGCTATLAPTKPIFSDGLAAFSASATFTSDAKDGVEV